MKCIDKKLAIYHPQVLSQVKPLVRLDSLILFQISNVLLAVTEGRRFDIAMEYVNGMNRFLMQKNGGSILSPKIPREFKGSKSCTMCLLKCVCLGPSCRGNKIY